ncbi:21899_t:CDS:2, partial [Gigaspora rosea]
YDILADIQQDLHIYNPSAQVFRSAGQSVHGGQPITLRILSGQGFDISRYNCSTTDEIAVLLIDNNADSGCDILLRTTQGQLQRISECHAAYDPLQYPLLFPYGQLGWYADSNLHELISTGMHTKLTKFFEICREDSTAANLLYSEFPKFFCWVKGAWIRRKRSGSKVISRLYSCSPNDSEQDFIYEARQHGENIVLEDLLIISRALAEIEDHLRQCGKYLTDFSELPTIQHDLLNIDKQTQLFAEELSFSRDELQRILEGVSLLNDEQRAVYDAGLRLELSP